MLRPRAYLSRLKPYELPSGLTSEKVEPLRLDQNENFAAASECALIAARDACGSSARYPDADARALREAIADLHGLEPERIVCARGAMELISLLATVYLEPGVSAVVSEFGYLYFRTAIRLAGAEVLQAPEPAMRVDPVLMAAQVRDHTRLVFVANPGNPTGSFLYRSECLRLREALPESVILVIDEAYAEFVPLDDYRSSFDLVDGGNTVVLRTFSKIYGLAGMRAGWGYFPPEIATHLRILQQPNGISTPAQAAAAAAIGDQRHIDGLRQRTLEIRSGFIESLRRMGLDPLPSFGNFVLVKFESPASAAQADAHLRSDAIAVRGVQAYGLHACLRVTLGTEEEMQRVVSSLERWMDQK